jgi:outer membrane protein OmpA-like peptidoglycan-associated protein
MKNWVKMAGLALAVSSGVISAGAARAADPPAQYKPEDVVKAYSGATASGCAPGTVPAADGSCDPVVHPRGFSLATPGATKAGPSKSSPTRASHGVYGASSPLTAQAKSGDLLIGFALGSAELTPQARSNARAFAVALKSPELSGDRFAIGGHTDTSGSASRNQALSEARAQAVKTFLVAEGVDASRLEAKGYGSARLADPHHPTSPSNRRVEGLRLN